MQCIQAAYTIARTEKVQYKVVQFLHFALRMEANTVMQLPPPVLTVVDGTIPLLLISARPAHVFTRGRCKGFLASG